MKGSGKQFSECIFFFGLKGFARVGYTHLVCVGDSSRFIEIKRLKRGQLVENKTILEE